MTLFLVLFTSTVTAEKVTVKNAWINEAPPMARSLAGYMEIHNKADKSIMIRSITSTKFERSEFHKTEIKDGMARMTPVSHLTIEPRSKITFTPGGLHLMLINPSKALKAGDEVPVTLHFTNDTKVTFNVKVKKMSSTHDHSGHEMNHDKEMVENNDNHENMKHDHKPHKH